jgi:dTDP-4-amino-4,6-dideoxygalactose transaminase
MRDMSLWTAICREARIHLIEDCAQAHLARWDDRVAGSIGAAGAYSFYPTKNLGAIGDGGAVVTRSAGLARRIGQLRNYGQSERYVHPLTGMNSRLDELQAALLSERLAWLAPWTERRRQIAAAYAASLSHPAIDVPVRGGESDSLHLYVVRSRFRDALAAHLASEGIETGIHYPVPDHRQPAFADRFAATALPVTERLANEVLTLPCHPGMSDEEVQHVIAACARFAA